MGEDDDPSVSAISAAPCPLPPGRKTYWRSASWSSRLSAEHGKECLDNTESNAARSRRFPVPLTPRTNHQSKGRPCLPPLQPLSITRHNLEEWPKAGSDDIGEWHHPPTPSGLNKGLKLDLSSFQQNSDPNETIVRDKIAFFDKECSKVAEHIYLGGTAVARDREILRQHGITHVLNCVGFVCPEYFKADLVYKTLWLQDSPSEDITSILYDVFDYFEDVREQGGRVLVHCCQGVSRSTSLVIAYLMWRESRSFDDAFQCVKIARGIANPNMGFACQLLQCQKRVHAIPLSPSSLLRMYRMAPHSPYDPLHLVPKLLNDPSLSALDSRGAFIVHVPSAIFVWIGENCDPVMERDAKAAAFQVVRYERVQGPVITVEEGQEPADFWDSFWSISVSVDNSENSRQVKKNQVESVVNVGIGRRKIDSYDEDFDLFHKAMTGGIVPPFSSTTGVGQETLVPARESNWSILRRKFVSGSVKEWMSRTSLSSVYSDSKIRVDSKDAAINKNELISPSSSLTSDTSANSKSGSDSPLLSSSTASSPSPSPAYSIISDSSSSPHHLVSNQESLSADSCLLPYPKTLPLLGKSETFSVSDQMGNFSPSKSETFSSVFDPCTRDDENADINVQPNYNQSSMEHDSLVGKEVLQFHVDKLSKQCEMNDNEARSAKLVPIAYSWPDLQKMENFRTENLHRESVVLVLVSGIQSEEERARKLFLWIGNCYEHQDLLAHEDRHGNNVNDCRQSAYEEIDWVRVGQNFLSKIGLSEDTPVEVVKEEEELENFLELINS